MARKIMVAIVFAVGLTVLSVLYLPIPFLWIGLVACGVLMLIAVGVTSSTTKIILVNAAIICLTIGAFEGYLSRQQKTNPHFEGGYVERYYDPTNSEILGYRPRKNTRIDSRKYFKDELLYDVTYTIDANGLRVSPPYTPDADDACLVFFGGSFTFGEGVNDNQAAPFRVGEKLRGRYRIFNFGFHGYGPHQMLSAIESGLVQSIADCKAKYIFYQALVTHVRRSAGLALWDMEGPRYVLTANTGTIKRDGYLFQNYRLPLPIIKLLKKSYIFKTSIRRLHRTVGNEELDLFVEIVNRAKQETARIYPASEFHVILWTPFGRSERPAFKAIQQGFAERGIRFTLITDILPGLHAKGGKTKYKIRIDGHPNAYAHDLISDFVVQWIGDRD